MFGAMGCHPKQVSGLSADAFLRLRRVHEVAGPKMVAVGEIGLDYSGRSVVGQGRAKRL